MFAYHCRICQLKQWEEILLIVTQQCQAGMCKPLTSESMWAVAAQDWAEEVRLERVLKFGFSRNKISHLTVCLIIRVTFYFHLYPNLQMKTKCKMSVILDRLLNNSRGKRDGEKTGFAASVLSDFFNIIIQNWNYFRSK